MYHFIPSKLKNLSSSTSYNPPRTPIWPPIPPSPTKSKWKKKTDTFLLFLALWCFIYALKRPLFSQFMDRLVIHLRFKSLKAVLLIKWNQLFLLKVISYNFKSLVQWSKCLEFLFQIWTHTESRIHILKSPTCFSVLFKYRASIFCRLMSYWNCLNGNKSTCPAIFCVR